MTLLGLAHHHLVHSMAIVMPRLQAKLDCKPLQRMSMAGKFGKQTTLVSRWHRRNFWR